jgi:cyclomaltodextrinase / maltogenic alpha-amylase / neopullulanase
MTDNADNLTEFIFGNLSQPEGRLRRLKTSRLGLYHPPLPAPRPDEDIEITVSVGIDIAVLAIDLYYSTDGTIPTPDNPRVRVLPFIRRSIDWDTLAWSYLETWTATISGQPNGTLIQYTILATTPTGIEISCPYLDRQGIEKIYNLGELDQQILNEFGKHNPPRVYGFFVAERNLPDWFCEAIIYEIFVDRFAGTTDLPDDLDLGEPHGGTIAGIISQLDYLVDLGITCIWLTPIFASSSYHGYDPKDHQAIDPRYGSIEEVKILLAAAKKRNLRIIFDFVANHFSNEHPAFIAAVKDKNNPQYSWFRFRNWPEEYDCFFDVPSQPEVNSDHLEVRQYLIESARYWLQLGVDGFRLDYANGCTHAFWSVFHCATRQENPDSVIFGEIVEVPSFLRSYTGIMEGCLDFKFLELSRGFFAYKNLSVSQFDKALSQHLAYFTTDLVLPSFLDNHDMNRFLWIVGEDKRRLKLAALCQFTLPNPPIIYYGTEVGVSQRATVGRLEESRVPQSWGEQQDRELLEFYQRLIRFRRDNLEMIKWERQAFLLDDEREIYGYLIGRYRVILNNSDRPNFIALSREEIVFSTDSESGWTGEKELAIASFSGLIFEGII